jgi:hypothetical protein
MQTCSSNMANGVSKNQSFYINFKNVTLILAKSAPKKSFCQKTVLIRQKVFWVHLYIFAISKKRRIFYTPFDLFYLIESQCVLSLN